MRDAYLITETIGNRSNDKVRDAYLLGRFLRSTRALFDALGLQLGISTKLPFLENLRQQQVVRDGPSNGDYLSLARTTASFFWKCDMSPIFFSLQCWGAGTDEGSHTLRQHKPPHPCSLTADRIVDGFLSLVDSQPELLQIRPDLVAAVIKHQRVLKFSHLIKCFCFVIQPLQTRKEGRSYPVHIFGVAHIISLTLSLGVTDRFLPN